MTAKLTMPNRTGNLQPGVVIGGGNLPKMIVVSRVGHIVVLRYSRWWRDPFVRFMVRLENYSA